MFFLSNLLIPFVVDFFLFVCVDFGLLLVPDFEFFIFLLILVPIGGLLDFIGLYPMESITAIWQQVMVEAHVQN